MKNKQELLEILKGNLDEFENNINCIESDIANWGNTSTLEIYDGLYDTDHYIGSIDLLIDLLMLEGISDLVEKYHSLVIKYYKLVKEFREILVYIDKCTMKLNEIEN